MLRKSGHLKNGRSEIPRSAKQVELVKRAVSRSPEVCSPMTEKDSKLKRVTQKQSIGDHIISSVPSKPKFST
jgi:hypothetical protein